MDIRFTKMHGAGNDYIYVNTMLYPIADPAEASRRWSQHHYSIGSDGLILIGQADREDADFSMRIFNNDGSEAMMCGNGARCVARYLHDYHLTDRTDIRLQTLAGIKVLHLNLDSNGEVRDVTVDMGRPTDMHPLTLNLTQTEVRSIDGMFVSMGNPHFVVFMSDVEHFDIQRYGSALTRHEAFADGCNIEFVSQMPDGKLRMRVWERGSGITLACGTGACATAVAASLTGHAGRESDIVMDGGTLHIHWSEEDDHIYMTGPAEIAYEGVIRL